jgi:hypothetical protein
MIPLQDMGHGFCVCVCVCVSLSPSFKAADKMD